MSLLHHSLYLFLFLLCVALTEAHPRKAIHKQMSPDELRQVFQVNSHEEVPEYEVVHVRSFSKRSTGGERELSRQVHLTTFGQSLELNLQPNQYLLRDGKHLRMWAAEPMEDGVVDYQELPQDDYDIGDIYQDEQNEAALLLRHDGDNGYLLMDGTIGSELVVKPLPASIRNQFFVEPPASEELNDDELFLDDLETVEEEVAVRNGFPLGDFPNGDEISLINSVENQRTSYNNNSSDDIGNVQKNRTIYIRNNKGMHIVYKRDILQSLSDYDIMEPGNFQTQYRNKRSFFSKRDAPYVIYPEILVVIDYDGYRLHNRNNVQIKRYFVSFWNGVDLRYKLLNGPRVRVSIAGIIISRGRDATPYLEKNRVGRDALDSAASLTDMGKYLFKERRLPVYDIAVAITKLDMCRRQYARDNCNRGTAGFAYVGGACVVNKRLQKVNSVAIVEDTGGFSGIIVAAHEVGHLLGAVHDGSPPPSYLGGPGAEQCQWKDGYIMSDLRHTEKGFRWSVCSVRQFHHFLNGETATCLYNTPHEDDSLPRVLPGKLLSLDAQCRKDRGTSACFKDDRVCAQLFCFDSESGYCVSYRPAAEGSPCGGGKYCLNGSCVKEHENAISDYSHYTPAFSRRTAYQSAATQTRPVYVKSTTQSMSTRRTTARPTTHRTTRSTSTTKRNGYWWNYWSRATSTQKSSTTATQKSTAIPTTTKTTPTTTTYTTTTSPPTVTTTPSPTTTTTTQRTTTTTRSLITRRTTTSTTTVRTTTKKTEQFEKETEKGDTECEDRINTIAGSMTCKEFLRSFGFQYCKYEYIQMNCCASHRILCNRSRWVGR